MKEQENKQKKVDISFYVDNEGVGVVANMTRDELYRCSECLLSMMYSSDYESYITLMGMSLIKLYQDKGDLAYASLLDAVANVTDKLDKAGIKINRDAQIERGTIIKCKNDKKEDEEEEDYEE